MITELLDMFNRTHTGNSDNDRKDFVILVNIILTSMGSDFYTYMRMLEVNDRKSEAEQIKEYRDMIFALRDGYGRGSVHEEEIVRDLRIVKNKLDIQVMMLRTIEGRQWEAQLFQSIQNDIPNMIFHMENIASMKIPQRVRS